MTIKKPQLHIINNTHHEKTMAELKKLLDEKGMTQAELASALDRDKTTINRWSKNSREITMDNAVKISEVLKCHPIEVWQPKKEVLLKHVCNLAGRVKVLNKEEQYYARIPFEFYTPTIRAVLMDTPGNHIDGQIWLFDIPKVKKFRRDGIGKICYMTASKEYLKRTKRTKKTSTVIALLESKGNSKFDILNSYTKEPVNDHCLNCSAEDFEIVSPLLSTYILPHFYHKDLLNK